MRLKIIVVAVLLAAQMIGAAAFSGEEESAESGKQKRTILTVTETLKNAREYRSKKIVIVGTFMGWDGRCQAKISQYDWMLQAENGDCIWVRGLFPEDCSAVTKIGEGRKVAVEGTLRLVNNRPVFFSSRKEKLVRKQKEKEEQAEAERVEKAKETLLEIEKQSYEQQMVFTVGELLQNPVLFTGIEFTLKGQYYGGEGKCGGEPPADAADWMIEDLFRNCIYVHGPVPTHDGKIPAAGALVSIKATMAKKVIASSDVFYVEALPEKAAEPEKEKSSP